MEPYVGWHVIYRPTTYRDSHQFGRELFGAPSPTVCYEAHENKHLES